MRLLRQRSLALLFAGGALNAIGSWATLIALWGFGAYHFHAGPNQIALLGLAWTAPGAVFSIAAGAPIDRFGPKTVMIASNVVGAATAIGMVAATAFSTLVALAVGSGVVQAFGRPAATSLPPRLVDDSDLLAANSLLGVAEQSAIIFGPLAGSLAIEAWGLRAAFIFDAATFVVSIAAVLPLRLRPVVRSGNHEASGRDLLAGFRLARRTPDVRRILTMATMVFCSYGAFAVMEPLYVRDVLHRPPAVLGYLQSVFGIGLLGCTALLPRLGERVVNVKAIAWSVLVSGGAAALYLSTRDIFVALVGVFIWGVDIGFFFSPMQTLLQRAAPSGTEGRVMALAGFADGAGGVVAIPLTGLVVGFLGVSATGALVGGLLGAVGTWGWLASTSDPAPVSYPLEDALRVGIRESRRSRRRPVLRRP